MGLGTVVAGIHALIGVVPLSLYCTAYDVMGVPPSDEGGRHAKDMLFTPD
jgi:hypothetical protein